MKWIRRAISEQHLLSEAVSHFNFLSNDHEYRPPAKSHKARSVPDRSASRSGGELTKTHDLIVADFCRHAHFFVKTGAAGHQDAHLLGCINLVGIRRACGQAISKLGNSRFLCILEHKLHHFPRPLHSGPKSLSTLLPSPHRNVR